MENVPIRILQRKERTEDVLLTEHCNFQTLSLKESVLQGLTEAKFYIPSPIQAKAIPLGRCGLDLIVQAKSGTGKTAVFTIVSLEIVNTEIKELQVVVVAPTREIAFQIKEVMTTIGKHMKDLKVGCFIGGLPMEDDIKTAKDCHIAVGAPGRLVHLIKKDYLSTSSVKLLVLDEGDKLMEKSYLNDISYMCNELPIQKQMIAASATFSKELKTFLQAYMHRSTFITPKVEIPILLGLRQFFSEITSSENTMHKLKNKAHELNRLFNKIAFTQCMIFCNYESQINAIKNFLKGLGWDVLCISGSQPQSDRLKTLGTLKDFKCRILLSTDLTARGIDATNVDVVINFDVPIDANTYLHRMGRAGRYGCKGICITITSNKKDRENLQKILGLIGGTQMSIAKLPDEDELLLDLFSCDLNKLPRLCGILYSNKVDTDSCNVTKSILEVKTMYKKKLSESDTILYEFERMCVEAIDENINKDEAIDENINKDEAIDENINKDEAIDENINKDEVEEKKEMIVDEKLDSAAVNSDKSITTQNNLKDVTVVADPIQITNSLPSLDSLTQWTLVKETVLEDSTSNHHSSALSASQDALNNQKFLTQLTAHKNVSMFHLNQVLLNETKDLEAATNSVTEYLKMKDIEKQNNLRELSNLFSSSTCQDVLKNLDAKQEEWRSVKASRLQIKNKKDLIFKFGYDYLCKDGTHWINGLGDNYKPAKDKNEVNEEYNKSVVEDVEENNENVVEYVEENNEEILDDYEETSEFDIDIEEAMDAEQTATAGTSNQEIPNEDIEQQSEQRQYNSNTYNNQHWNFCQGSDKIDNYKHYGQYYNYPIKRFLKSLSEPIDSQKSEEAFKLWLQGMSEVTKYLHRGIYWDLMYGSNY